MDDDLVEHEMHWQPPVIDRRWFKTKPAGVNAMNAIAGLLWLSMLAGYLHVKGSVSTEQGLAPVLILFGVLFIAFIVSHWVSRRIWVGIGPGPRAVLRTLGVFGSFPIIAAGVVGVAVIFALPALRRDHAAVEQSQSFEGVEYAPILDAKRKQFVPLTAPQAAAACAERGPGWRLPTAADVDFLNRRLLDRPYKHTLITATAEPGDPQGVSAFSYDRRKRSYVRTMMLKQVQASVVCIRPPTP